MNNAESHSCPICQSEKTKFLFEHYDDRFGYPGMFHLDRCADCGHIFLRETFTPQELTDMYCNYYPRKLFDIESWKPYPETKGFFAWLDGDNARSHRWVPKNVKVLDIGCGYCETLGYHQARGCEAWGCEADTNSQKIAERYGFKNFKLGLFNPDDYEKEYFDYVTIFQVLEHCANPKLTLEQIRTILKPGGKLIISIPNLRCIGRYFFGRGWLNWHTPYHLNIYSDKSFRFLADETGFNVIEWKSLTNSLHLLVQWAFMVIRSRKMGVASPLCETDGHFSNAQKKRWDVRLYNFLEKTRSYAWLERLSDACGIGEHGLYFAEKR